MASGVGSSLFHVSSLRRLCCKRWTPLVTQIRSSMYNPTYLDPTLDKGSLSQPLEEDDPRNYQPIRAALNEQTTSPHADPLVARFTRLILTKGKKELAKYIMDRTFEQIKYIQLEKYHKAESPEERNTIELNPKVIFHQAVENCKPVLTLQKVKRGGVHYKVPIPVKPNHQMFQAMSWIKESAMEKHRTVRMWEKLAYELLEASRNEGKSVRKKVELHRTCEANKAYAHFRWGK